MVDPGTFKYTGDPAGRRAHFRSSAAHSTAEVDGVGQAAPEGPFSWRSRPGARLVSWHHDDVLDVAEGEHHGYEELPGGVVHRRKIVLVKGGFCAVSSPLRLSAAAVDALSDAEVKALLAHNRKGEKLCGWKP